MENIYCISGLGADERIFRKLQIKDARLQHLPWVTFNEHDEMGCYAQKMAAQIPEKNPIILGLSFGGMLATEIARQIPVRQVFVISSAKGRHELPDVSGALKFLIRHDLIPYGLFKKPNKVLFSRFGAETEEEKQMLASIMESTDTDFLGWAFNVILNWQNTEVPPPDHPHPRHRRQDPSARLYHLRLLASGWEPYDGLQPGRRGQRHHFRPSFPTFILK